MIKGATDLLTGLQQLLANASLRAILWRMLALLLVMMVAAAAGVFWLAEYLAGLWIPASDTWYWQLLGWIAGLLAFVLALISGAVAYIALGSAAVAPWLDLLAMRVESMQGQALNAADQSPWQMVVQSLVHSLRPLLGLVLWGVASLLCFWLPPLATALWLWGSLRFFSYELIDTPASRRGWDFRVRKQHLDRQRWYYLGFSGVAMALMLVPIVNLLVLPAAVIALSSRGDQLSG